MKIVKFLIVLMFVILISVDARLHKKKMSKKARKQAAEKEQPDVVNGGVNRHRIPVPYEKLQVAPYTEKVESGNLQ